MSLLTIVEKFAKRSGWVVPTTVASNANTKVVKLLGLLNELVEELVYSPYTYSFLIREATFTSVSGTDQGNLDTLAPAGFRSMIEGSLFDRTQNLQIHGPISSEEWQRRQAMNMTGTCYEYRIWRNKLYLTPSAVSGHSMAFEYRSKFPVYTPGGSPTYKSNFTVDTDLSLIPEEILVMGLRYKWTEDNGFDASNFKNSFESMLAVHQAEDGTKGKIDLSGSSNQGKTGIIIPFGSYNT